MHSPASTAGGQLLTSAPVQRRLQRADVEFSTLLAEWWSYQYAIHGSNVFLACRLLSVLRVVSVAYLECAKDIWPCPWGTEVPSGVRDKAPVRSGLSGNEVSQKQKLIC